MLMCFSPACFVRQAHVWMELGERDLTRVAVHQVSRTKKVQAKNGYIESDITMEYELGKGEKETYDIDDKK